MTSINKQMPGGISLDNTQGESSRKKPLKIKPSYTYEPVIAPEPEEEEKWGVEGGLPGEVRTRSQRRELLGKSPKEPESKSPWRPAGHLERTASSEYKGKASAVSRTRSGDTVGDGLDRPVAGGDRPGREPPTGKDESKETDISQPKDLDRPEEPGGDRSKDLDRPEKSGGDRSGGLDRPEEPGGDRPKNDPEQVATTESVEPEGVTIINTPDDPSERENERSADEVESGLLIKEEQSTDKGKWRKVPGKRPKHEITEKEAELSGPIYFSDYMDESKGLEDSEEYSDSLTSSPEDETNRSKKDLPKRKSSNQKNPRKREFLNQRTVRDDRGIPDWRDFEEPKGVICLRKFEGTGEWSEQDKRTLTKHMRKFEKHHSYRTKDVTMEETKQQLREDYESVRKIRTIEPEEEEATSKPSTEIRRAETNSKSDRRKRSRSPVNRNDHDKMMTKLSSSCSPVSIIVMLVNRARFINAPA